MVSGIKRQRKGQFKVVKIAVPTFFGCFDRFLHRFKVWFCWSLFQINDIFVILKFQNDHAM